MTSNQSDVEPTRLQAAKYRCLLLQLDEGNVNEWLQAHEAF
jgi:hypothetical protein